MKRSNDNNVLSGQPQTCNVLFPQKSIFRPSGRYKDYFEYSTVDKMKFGTCNICKSRNKDVTIKMQKSNTSGLRWHLKHKHRDTYDELFPGTADEVDQSQSTDNVYVDMKQEQETEESPNENGDDFVTLRNWDPDESGEVPERESIKRKIKGGTDNMGNFVTLRHWEPDESGEVPERELAKHKMKPGMENMDDALSEHPVNMVPDPVQPDQFHLIGMMIAGELRQLHSEGQVEQIRIAERLMYDAIFKAQFSQLTTDAHIVIPTFPSS